jgi:hypothetical protein
MWWYKSSSHHALVTELSLVVTITLDVGWGQKGEHCNYESIIFLALIHNSLSTMSFRHMSEGFSLIKVGGQGTEGSEEEELSLTERMVVTLWISAGEAVLAESC